MLKTNKIITLNLILLFFFLTPFQFKELNLLYIPYRLLPLLIVMSESLNLIKFIRNNIYRYIYLIAFGLISGLLALGTNEFNISFLGTAQYIVNFGLFLPVLISLLKDKENQLKVFYSFSLGVLISGIFVFLFFVPLIDIPKSIITYNLTGGAITPRLALGGVNDYSMVILLHFSWLVYLNKEVKRKNIIFKASYFIYIFDIYLVILAGSRIAFYSLIVVIIANTFRKRRFFIMIGLITIGLLIMSSFNIITLYGNRLYSTFEIGSRFYTFEEIKHIKPFGLGIGTAHFVNYYGNTNIITDHSLHNNFIILFYETGFLVAPLFYYFLYKTISENGSKRYIILTLFILNICVITHIYTDIFIIFIALSLSSLRKRQPTIGMVE